MFSILKSLPNDKIQEIFILGTTLLVRCETSTKWLFKFVIKWLVEEQEVALQTLRDRYHSADFVPSDRYRIELREESVLAFLGDKDHPQSVKIFLQVGEKAIDLLTHEVRMERLKQFSV